MQLAPIVGMGWRQAEPGLWGLCLGGFLSWGEPTCEGVGGSWGSFAQCVLWMLLGTPGLMLDPTVLQGGEPPPPPTDPPSLLLPPMLTL